jgi:hypothetical protein
LAWLTLALALATMAQASSTAAAQSGDNEDLLNFLVGDYALIGREPGDGAAYAGTARIDRAADGVVIERRIGDRKVSARGRIEVPQPPGEGHVLRFRWADGQPIVMTCLIDGDLDNYARLTCLWDVTGGPARNPGQEALFATATWPRRAGGPWRRRSPAQRRAATKMTPAAMSSTPSQLRADNRSPRKATPKMATSTTLSLSIGATRAASPCCKARK